MENDLFEKVSVPKAYFKFALPVVFSLCLTLVYNLVDTFFIAKTGNTNLVAGVSIGTPVFTIMIALGDMFGLGGSSLISRLLGNRDEKRAREISAFCYYAAIVLGLVVTGVMLLFRRQFLTLLGAEADTWQYASAYYTGIAVGAPFIILQLVPTNVLRCEGLAKEGMIASMAGTLVNIALDPLFILTFGWGAGGAAYATVAANVVVNIVMIYYYLKKSKCLSVDPRDIRVDWPSFGQIMLIGIPASLTNFMTSFCTALTNRHLLEYGTTPVAAMGIAMKVNSITFMIMVGFAFGAQALIAFNYGAGNKARLRSILKFSYGFLCAFSLAFEVIIILAARPLVSVFMSDPDIVAYGTEMLRFQQAGMVFCAIVLVSNTVFQSVGKAFPAFLMAISRQGVVFFAAITVAHALLGYQGVIMAQFLADAITAVIALLCYYLTLHRELKE